MILFDQMHEHHPSNSAAKEEQYKSPPVLLDLESCSEAGFEILDERE